MNSFHELIIEDQLAVFNNGFPVCVLLIKSVMIVQVAIV